MEKRGFCLPFSLLYAREKYKNFNIFCYASSTCWKRFSQGGDMVKYIDKW